MQYKYHLKIPFLNMAYTYNYIEFEQPSGSFLLTIVPAQDILEYYFIHQRRYVKDVADGTQREDSNKRIKEIAKYVTTVDAAFPTAIIMAAAEGTYVIDKQAKTITINESSKIEVVDGQHRIEGLKLAAAKTGIECIKEFNLPCVFLLEPLDEEKAFIFATINGKQNKVNASVVYDLFGVSKTPDPYNILHTLARTLNFKEDSPFKNRLKMLGKKSDSIVTESLTQGTFVNTLIPKISSDPMIDRDLMKQGKYDELIKDESRILRDYMLNKKSELLVPLFENIFNSVKKTWDKEWVNHNRYILSKTTGYIGIMKGIDELIKYGKQVGTLSEAYFFHFFQLMKIKIDLAGLELTADYFQPGGVGENAIRELMKQTYSENYPLTEKVLQEIKTKSSKIT